MTKHSPQFIYYKRDLPSMLQDCSADAISAWLYTGLLKDGSFEPIPPAVNPDFHFSEGFLDELDGLLEFEHRP